MAIAAGLALLVVVAPNGGGTYALWNSSATVMVDGTITAGSPAVKLDGFQNFNGFEYKDGNVAVTKNITITNTGNVTLHSIFLEGTAQNPHWDARVVRSAEPAGDLGVGKWSRELKPGDTFPVAITLTLSVAHINELIDMRATSSGMQARVTAQAGTGWVVGDESDVFEASVATEDTDDDEGPGSLIWGAWSDANIFLQLTGIPAGTDLNKRFHVYASYAGSEPPIHLEEQHVTGHWPQYGIVAGGNLKPLWQVPEMAYGSTRQIDVRVVWGVEEGNEATFATGRFWVTRVDANNATLHIVPPSGWSAPAPAPAAPAPVAPAPQAPAQAPEADAPATAAPETQAPDAPAHAPAPTPETPEQSAPDPTPGPTEPAAPAPDAVEVETPAPTPSPEPQPSPTPAPEPEPTPEASPAPEPPAEIGEVELDVTENEDGDGLKLTWQNPDGIPDDATYALHVNGEATGIRTDTVNVWFDLPPARVPSELWTGEGDVHELTITIVAELPDGTSQPIAEITVWAVDGAEGAVTLHATDPTA